MECQPQQDVCWPCTFLGWCCCHQLFVGRGSAEPRAACWESYPIYPMEVWGESLCSVWWHLDVSESSTDKVKSICFKHKLCSPQVQRLPLLPELPNTQFWVSDIGLIQVGFVGKMIWWNGKIMVVCLEKEILCDCLYCSVLSRRQPHERVLLGHPGNVVCH